MRDSGAIEQDADLVIFIHSDDYYNDENKKNNIWNAELILAKQRNGPTGTVEMKFKRDITRFIEETVTENEDIPFGGI